ncbi:MAG TPA: trigger factor [Micropepsaceae bacterium]|nr:trigger factor [Micropepsaceae bacterium]
MQITETISEPLHREFTVLIAAPDLEAKLTGKIAEMQPKIHMKGFRPGKAPISFLKKTYGKSLMGDIVNETINESSEQLLKEKEIKPATQPRVDFVNSLDNVIAGKADLEFTMKVDLMPDFQLANLSELKAERLVADVADDAVDEALKRLADSQKTYSDKGEGAVAEKGDAVTIDFEGKIGGEAFEGGKAEDFDLTLGSGAFIPGFEDQLIGAKAGEARTVSVKFPDTYGAANLAGKDAEFAVTVKAVKSANDVVIDDELAKKVGVESLDELKNRIREQLQGEYARASRTHLKRRILDTLDSAHSFDLPGGMVQAEFDAIWAQVQAELQREGVSPEDEGKSEDELKAEYRTIAERRVRLGLLLAKIGEQNAIQVSQDEVNRALAARARQYPGQEKQVIEYYTRNPQAMTELRVPLFEDKVVDFLGELIEVHDRKVSREILFLDPDDAEEKLKAAEAPAAEVAPAAETEEAKPAKKKAKAKAEAKTEGEAGAASDDHAAAEAKPKKTKKKKDEEA